MSDMSPEMERLDCLIDECSVGVDVDHGLIMHIRGAIATLARETEALRSEVIGLGCEIDELKEN